MIIAQLTGGLGNQLFQYAFGRQLSIRNTTELKLDVSAFENTNYAAARRYALEPFNVMATVASNSELKPFRKSKLVTFVSRVLPYYQRAVVYEPFFQFDPRALMVANNRYVVGYWQSEKYFKQCEKEIRAELTLTKPLVHPLVNEVSKPNTVSVHIRRGDYVSDATTNAIHGVCSPEYYQKALAIIKQTTPHPHFFIFSDDTQWVKKTMNFSDAVTYVADAGLKDYEELELMSKCSNHIIANSSFSWWGAWLNSSAIKKVIAPKKWFNDTAINTKDLIPDSWIRV